VKEAAAANAMSSGTHKQETKAVQLIVAASWEVERWTEREEEEEVGKMRLTVRVGERKNSDSNRRNDHGEFDPRES